MVKYTLWGTTVDLDLPKETFPSDEEMKKMDDDVLNSDHGFFETNRGDKLHFRKWLPPNGTNVKGVVVFQHGIQAHGGLAFKKDNGDIYKIGVLAKLIPQAGYALYSLDMLGHGFSEGTRFYIPEADWKINRDDYSSFASHVSKEEGSDLPLFLMGESYGACLALHVAKQWQDLPADAPSNFKGISILAPAIIGDLPAKPVIDFLTLLAYYYPTWSPFFMPNPVSPDRIWQDEEVMKEFTSDRRREMNISAGGKKFVLGTALGLLNALERVREDAIPGLEVPFYVGHGTNDFGVPLSGTEYLLQHAATAEEDRCVNILDGGYHDLLSEENREETVGSVLDWMDSRVDK